MAIRNDSFRWNGKIDRYNKIKDNSAQSLENIILNFLKDSRSIPKRRFVVARNQIFSLYRRMKLYPEKRALCKGYNDQIIQIIKLERGIEK